MTGRRHSRRRWTPVVGHGAVSGSRPLWLRDSDTRPADPCGSRAAHRPWLAHRRTVVRTDAGPRRALVTVLTCRGTVPWRDTSPCRALSGPWLAVDGRARGETRVPVGFPAAQAHSQRPRVAWRVAPCRGSETGDDPLLAETDLHLALPSRCVVPADTTRLHDHSLEYQLQWFTTRLRAQSTTIHPSIAEASRGPRTAPRPRRCCAALTTLY